MELTIKVPFETSEQMEDNLNRAIDELCSVLKKKGLIEIKLTGMDYDLKNIYTVAINSNQNNKP